MGRKRVRCNTLFHLYFKKTNDRLVGTTAVRYFKYELRRFVPQSEIGNPKITICPTSALGSQLPLTLLSSISERGRKRVSFLSSFGVQSAIQLCGIMRFIRRALLTRQKMINLLQINQSLCSMLFV